MPCVRIVCWDETRRLGKILAAYLLTLYPEKEITMPANPLTNPPKKRRRNPIIAQREARAAALANAPKGTGQVAPPAPPNPGTTPPPPPAPSAAVVDKAREALETLPDAELIAKAEVLLPNYDESWDRTQLITALLAAGVAG